MLQVVDGTWSNYVAQVWSAKWLTHYMYRSYACSTQVGDAPLMLTLLGLFRGMARTSAHLAGSGRWDPCSVNSATNVEVRICMATHRKMQD